MSATRQQIARDDAIAMLAECFMAQPGELTPQTPREAVPGWDSMGALMLIAELDERFGIELSAETSRKMKQVSDVLDFLSGHGVLRG